MRTIVFKFCIYLQRVEVYCVKQKKKKKNKKQKKKKKKKKKKHEAKIYFAIFFFFPFPSFTPCQRFLRMPASVTQLDACTTGDQEFSGLTSTGSATFYRGDLVIKYFLQSFSPLHRFKNVSFHLLAKKMCTILVNRLED